MNADLAELIVLLDRNLVKIDDFYIKRYAAYSRQLKVLKDGNDGGDTPSSLPTDSDALQELRVSLFELREQYRKLQWYSEVNRRGFTKITKKINKNFSNLAAIEQYLETKVDLKPFASHTDLLADVVFISDWLARVDGLIATHANSTNLSTDVPPIEHASTDPFYQPAMPPIDIDTAIRTDDEEALRRHISLALQQPSPPNESRYLISLLQRAINSTSYACVTLLLSQAPTLTTNDQPEQRNCLHKYLIHIGRLKLSNSLAKRGVKNTSMASRLIDRQELDDDPEDRFDQEKTTRFLSHIIQGLTEAQRPILMARDVYGRFPLHYAAEYGLLLATQAILSQLKEWDMYDLSAAADAECWQDLDGHAPLHLAVLGQHPRTTAALLSAESCDEFNTENIAARPRDDTTISSLQFAVRMQMPTMTRLLVKAGTDMNGQNDQGETTLHHAARRGYSTCLEALLIGSDCHQANLEVKDKTYGFTPLFHACVEGHKACVDLLINAGAKLEIFDHSGWRPIEHAAWNGHYAIANKLHGLPTPEPPAVEPAFGVPRYARASLEAGAGLPRKTLKDETMILVSLGSMDMRNPMPAVVLEGIERSVQQDTALSLVVSIEGGTGNPVTVDLPTTDDLSCFPITFMTPDPTKVRVLFDIVPTRAPKTQKHLIARAVGQPSSILPVMGPKMMTLQGFLSTPVLSASTLDVVGNVSFNFLVIKPFNHPPAGDERFPTFDLKGSGSTMIIGHRGWGMNIKDKNRIQVGENTLTAFQIAHKLGVPFVEFDIQLTKDHVPVIYHDFLVSETGIDAPVHTLTLEQFLHAGDLHAEQEEPDISSRSTSADGTVSPPNYKRFRSKSTSLTNDRSGRWFDMDHRMKFTRDYKTLGYKPNSRGKVIHERYATLEKLLHELPDTLGLYIEFSKSSLRLADGKWLSFQNFQCSTRRKISVWSHTILSSTPLQTLCSRYSTSTMCRRGRWSCRPSTRTFASCSHRSSRTLRSCSSATPDTSQQAISEPDHCVRQSDSLPAGI